MRSTTTTTEPAPATSALAAPTATANTELPRVAVKWRVAEPTDATHAPGDPVTGELARELRRYQRSRWIGAVTAVILLALVLLIPALT